MRKRIKEKGLKTENQSIKEVSINYLIKKLTKLKNTEGKKKSLIDKGNAKNVENGKSVDIKYLYKNTADIKNVYISAEIHKDGDLPKEDIMDSHNTNKQLNSIIPPKLKLGELLSGKQHITENLFELYNERLGQVKNMEDDNDSEDYAVTIGVEAEYQTESEEERAFREKHTQPTNEDLDNLALNTNNQSSIF